MVQLVKIVIGGSNSGEIINVYNDNNIAIITII